MSKTPGYILELARLSAWLHDECFAVVEGHIDKSRLELNDWSATAQRYPNGSITILIAPKRTVSDSDIF